MRQGKLEALSIAVPQLFLSLVPLVGLARSRAGPIFLFLLDRPSECGKRFVSAGEFFPGFDRS